MCCNPFEIELLTNSEHLTVRKLAEIRERKEEM
jgi:hypothetical protein